jgi:hypothetical protein
LHGTNDALATRVVVERRTRIRPTQLDRRRADEDVAEHIVGGIRLTRSRETLDRAVVSTGRTDEHRTTERRKGRSAEELKRNLELLLAEWERQQIQPKASGN